MPTAISSGLWNDGANWDIGSVPGPSDNCDLAGNAMTMATDITTGSITDSVGGGSLTPNLAGLKLQATLQPAQPGTALVQLSSPSMAMTFVGTIQQTAAGAIAIGLSYGATLQIEGTIYLNYGADSFPISFAAGQLTKLAGSTPPAAGDLRAGVTVGAVTGTLAVPAASDVRYGANVDDTVGTAYIPSAYDTRYGTNVDAGTGTCHVPTAAQTALGVNVDHTVGTLNVPTPLGPAPQCLVTTTTVDATGAILADQAVTFRLIKGPGTAAYAYGPLLSATSNGSGLLAVWLVQGAQYQVTLGTGQTVTISVPAGSSYALPELVG